MDNEDKFEEWVEKSLCYRWLHRNSWYYYSQLDVIFTYLIISIGIFNSIVIFVCNNYFDLDETIKNTETFILSTTSLGVSGIAQFQRKAKFYEKSQQHSQASKLFENYNRKLRNGSLLGRRTEEDLKETIQEYEEIANAQPEISYYSIRKFRKKYGKLKIWMPNILYDLRDLQKQKTINKNHSLELKIAFYNWVNFTKIKKENNMV